MKRLLPAFLLMMVMSVSAVSVAAKDATMAPKSELLTLVRQAVGR